MIGHDTPAWRVVLDGQDLTARIAPRLLELTLCETRGEEADQLDLRIHDHDGQMALPTRGVMLTVAIGSHQQGLIDKGQFRVDEVEHSGAPDIISIRARSADFTKDLRIRKSRSWHGKTLGAIVGGIAGEHGLTPDIDAALSPIVIDHLDQADESDIHLLTGLSHRFDATLALRDGSLLFQPIGQGQPLDRRSPPLLTLTRRHGDQHRYCVVDRDVYSGVRAYWTDKVGARRKSVLVGKKDNAKRLRETYSSERIAREHAQSAWRRIQRGGATLHYTLAFGRADLSPEQHLTLTGFKPEIDGTDWLVIKTTHTLTGSQGFSTALELETGDAEDKPGDS